MLLDAWLWGNVVLAAVGLGLLIEDICHRRRLQLRQRFYWEAVALFLISIGWGSADAVFTQPVEIHNRVRMVLSTTALVYFLFSIERVRRFHRQQEEHDGYGGQARA